MKGSNLSVGYSEYFVLRYRVVKSLSKHFNFSITWCTDVLSQGLFEDVACTYINITYKIYCTYVVIAALI